MKLLDNLFIQEKLKIRGPCMKQIAVAGLVPAKQFSMNFSSKLRKVAPMWMVFQHQAGTLTARSSQGFQTGSLAGNIRKIMVKDLVSCCCTASESQTHIFAKLSFSANEH